MNNCPFLGHDEDPQAHISFSSEHNYCYRTERPTAILFGQQQKYCLTKDYPNCPVYQDISHLTLPIDVGDRVIEQRRPNSKKFLIVIPALFVIIVFTMGWFYMPRSVANNEQLTAASMPVNPNRTPLPVMGEESVIRSTPSPTLQATVVLRSSPTPTYLPTSIPLTAIPLYLGTPNKTLPQLLIHKIAPGDNLARLASHFGTSVAAIRNVNYFLPVPLWVGTLVVIPINTIDVSELPAFEPYQVKERSMTLKDAASILNTTPELLIRYNPMDPNAILFVDSWLIVPRPFPLPTGLPLATQDGKIQNYDGE